MLDPFPVPAPRFLVAATKPFADAINLHSLPLHIHEIVFAAALYTFTEKVVSPWISNLFVPKIYSRLGRKARLNWDVHVVSMVQSCLINALSLYAIWFDAERKSWRSTGAWEQRIWGYYGTGGLCQSFALGYFLWDLYICSMNVDIFGWGMLAHAISAVAVFGLGYRPFIYFSAPVFLLYELSSPFLNIHWFCDKLNLTGSIYQAINGAFLVLTFFSCRLVWGIYSSVYLFWDFWWAIQAGHTEYATKVPMGRLDVMTTNELMEVAKDPIGQLRAFNREQYTPIWLMAVCLVSNIVLNSLNVFWFGKMIETIRTRFDPPWGTKGLAPSKHDTKSALVVENKISQDAKPRRPSIVQLNPQGGTVEEEIDPAASAVTVDVAEGGVPQDSGKKKGSVKAARAKAEEALNGPVGVVQDTKMERSEVVGVDEAIGTGIESASSKTPRSRRKG